MTEKCRLCNFQKMKRKVLEKNRPQEIISAPSKSIEWGSKKIENSGEFWMIATSQGFKTNSLRNTLCPFVVELLIWKTRKICAQHILIFICESIDQM